MPPRISNTLNCVVSFFNSRSNGLNANTFSFSLASTKLSDFKYLTFTWNKSIMDKTPKPINKIVWLMIFLMAKNKSPKTKRIKITNFKTSPSIKDFLSVTIAFTKSCAGASKAAF